MINPEMFGYSQTRSNTSLANNAEAAVRSRAAAASQNASLLEDRLERLSLVCMAMWSLLQDKTNLTEQDLIARVKMLDMMDGVKDGKATRTVSKCTQCNRVMAARHQRCLYCGAEKLTTSAFDAI